MSGQLRELEAWFVTGSQHLYGPEVLRKVEENARTSPCASTKPRTSPSGSCPSAS